MPSPSEPDDLADQDHRDAAGVEAAIKLPVSVTAWTLPSITSGAAASRRISSPWVCRSIPQIPRPYRPVAPGSLDRLRDPGELESLGSAVIDLGPIPDQAEHDLLR